MSFLMTQIFIYHSLNQYTHRCDNHPPARDGAQRIRNSGTTAPAPYRPSFPASAAFTTSGTKRSMFPPRVATSFTMRELR